LDSRLYKHQRARGKPVGGARQGVPALPCALPTQIAQGMQQEYEAAAVERAAQDYWLNNASFAAEPEDGSGADRETFYCLSMFPYPSGKLHMGHVRNYTIGDVIARVQRMRGYQVLQPMGWDAFGLPAENAAMNKGVPPGQWTRDNIAAMRDQLQRLGFGYDWSREFATCDPGYYRWQQWLFLRLWDAGLVERRNAVVNWDPVDQTVLANEQVIDGRGWRSGALVEQREIPQWFIRITDYADELVDDLATLDGWPDAVRTMQANWIGRSRGVEIEFPLADRDDHLTVYTTRPDTLYGVTYMAVAPQHPLAREAAARDADVARFVEELQRSASSEAAMETAEKKGMALGIEVVHPLTGERIPVWTANFVLMAYGAGAVMAVPAHDERDHAFAHTYGLPIRPVIGADQSGAADVAEGAFTAYGVLHNSGAFSGMTSTEAFEAIAQQLADDGRGRIRINYRLRDWGVSRQRYWGCPIPVVYCDDCGAVPVPDDQLPVRLPEALTPDGSGNPLAKDSDFLNCACPKCGQPARRETDTFDTFIDSSWYFARFASAFSDNAMLDDGARRWMPVDQYVGGVEHAVLHLLYARFFTKLMRDQGLLDCDEPFVRLLTQGMVVAPTFHREGDDGRRQWFNPLEVQLQRDERGAVLSATALSDGAPVQVGGIEKMSKSKNNGVDPQAMIDVHGADAVRLFMMFAAPPDQSLEWSDAGLEGASRFLRRLWRQVQDHVERGPVAGDASPSADAKALRRQLHETLQKVDADVTRRQVFNTAVAACMELLNAVSRVDQTDAGMHAVTREVLEALVRVLSPITPHITHALWMALGHEQPVIDADWPEADPEALVADEVTLVVQVNGKLRGRITVPADASREDIIARATEDEAVARHIGDQALRKQIVVPGKLVNLVV